MILGAPHVCKYVLYTVKVVCLEICRNENYYNLYVTYYIINSVLAFGRGQDFWPFWPQPNGQTANGQPRPNGQRANTVLITFSS
ncbi:hypothetical protein RclHR1_03380003 [Rhizophagus clarus]|uniref:Uncharacterized protein n=1 Tax=Rhizophagus clarus TaxID=94130 RepID=A0A2Z6RR06_9GLOM|nr:hypothetical protein RclHR1_03380003 [Rhizophagus clarus]GES94778.1 hypothetical protein RCL_e15124_RclHR1_03380003 [Rhizophagus clarus]